MSDNVAVLGDKFHIITRRSFDGDLRRHFAGEVVGMMANLFEVRGYAFVFNAGKNEYRRRPELRTRIFSFGDPGYIVNKLPREVNLESLEYRLIEDRLVVADESGFALDINEFGHLA